MRKGEELKAPRHASATASCDDHVTTYNIIPNNYAKDHDVDCSDIAYNTIALRQLINVGIVMCGTRPRQAKRSEAKRP